MHIDGPLRVDIFLLRWTENLEEAYVFYAIRLIGPYRQPKESINTPTGHLVKGIPQLISALWLGPQVTPSVCAARHFPSRMLFQSCLPWSVMVGYSPLWNRKLAVINQHQISWISTTQKNEKDTAFFLLAIIYIRKLQQLIDLVTYNQHQSVRRFSSGAFFRHFQPGCLRVWCGQM